MYVNESSIENSVKYFQDSTFEKPMYLSLFFLFKSLGMTDTKTLCFKSAKNQVPKNLFLHNLYLLSGLFDKDLELNTAKKSTLFPFSFEAHISNKDTFYNPGTEFHKMMPRIPDTIDNSLIDVYLNSDKNNNVKFNYQYKDIIKQYLPNKISLVYFSTWICRFIKFDDSINFKTQEFTRACINYTINFLNLTQLELNLFFIDDRYQNKIHFSDHKASITKIRSLFSFEEKLIPEFKKLDIPKQDNDLTLDIEETRKYINMNQKNPTLKEIKEILNIFKQTVFYGVPGIGKSKILKDLENDRFYEEIWFTQFNANTSYEDFIGGETLVNQEIQNVPGMFLKACVIAKKNPEKYYLYVLDEINRGNIARIFGETIVALDREYNVTLPKVYRIENEETETLTIPPNLHIIATMNSSDRSITNFDFALRRRFAFVHLYPDEQFVNESIKHDSFENIGAVFTDINNKILDVLSDSNFLLGQSYFINQNSNTKCKWTSTEFRLNFNYFILPTLEEYTLHNAEDLKRIVGDQLVNRLNNDEDFNKALKNMYPLLKEL